MKPVYENEEAVSSIVGILLMIAITIILSIALLIYSFNLLQGISKVPIEGYINETNSSIVFIENGTGKLEFYIYNLTLYYTSPKNITNINEFHISINGIPPSKSKYNGYSYLIINPNNQATSEFGNLILPPFIHPGNSNYVANQGQIIIISTADLHGEMLTITYSPTVGQINFALN